MSVHPQISDNKRQKEVQVANIRQELLAPVSAIADYSELLHEQIRSGQYHEIAQEIERIWRAARSLYSLVDSLLSADAVQALFNDQNIGITENQLRHDIRTPINAIKGYAEMLLEDMDGSSDATFKLDLEQLLAYTNRLLSQLIKIIDFNKNGKGQELREVSDASCPNMISRLVESIRPVDNVLLVPERVGNILIVDDLEANRELLSRRLTGDGHQVIAIGSGYKALQILEKEAFDLVLLDLMMPEMNGFEVLAKIKENPDTKMLPVIMVSALDETDSVIRCIEAGADDYLSKPINTTLLRARIKSGLEKKHWQDIEKQQKQFIHRAFSRYLSPEVVDQLVDNPERLSLRGERLEITCVFTDLAGFTSLMEGADLDQVLPVLNEYLDGMCRIVRQHKGTIDKIVGDALHVFFGAPIAQHDHAQRAVTAALAMDNYARCFITSDAAQAVNFGGTRIGVNTGPAVVGNFGGDAFFDYTAHGDTVNTAACMESVNRYFGTSICVTGATVEHCNNILFRPIASLRLKGKTQHVKAFEALTPDQLDPVLQLAYLSAYKQMASGDLQAQAAFEALKLQFPEDPLTCFHLQRLATGSRGEEIILTKK